MSPQGWLAEGAREAADPKRLTENRERLKSHVKRIQCQKRYDPDGGRPYCEESNAKEGPERMPDRPGASRPKRHATPRTPREGTSWRHPRRGFARKQPLASRSTQDARHFPCSVGIKVLRAPSLHATAPVRTGTSPLLKHLLCQPRPSKVGGGLHLLSGFPTASPTTISSSYRSCALYHLALPHDVCPSS